MFNLPDLPFTSVLSLTAPATRLLLVLGCLTATSAMAQRPCPSISANTGQTGWKLVSARNVNYTGPFATSTNKLRIVVHNEGSVTGLDAGAEYHGRHS